MFKSLSVVSIVATVALAQSSLIPTDISEKCSSFLTELNANSALQKCTTSLSGALAPFAPGATASSSVSAALTDVCGADVAAECPSNVFASQITAFYAACSEELTTKRNDKVVSIYDVLYVVAPMREAICAKADDGSWCAAAAVPAEGVSVDTIQAALSTKTGDSYTPNADAYTKYNVPFLLLTPESADLCTSCTRKVLDAYIKHESNLPYAPGLGNSKYLSSQTPLYTGILEKCGANFMVSEVAAAGGIGNSLNNKIGGSNGAISHGVSGVVASVVGLASLAALL